MVSYLTHIKTDVEAHEMNWNCGLEYGLDYFINRESLISQLLSVLQRYFIKNTVINVYFRLKGFPSGFGYTTMKKIMFS